MQCHAIIQQTSYLIPQCDNPTVSSSAVLRCRASQRPPSPSLGLPQLFLIDDCDCKGETVRHTGSLVSCA